MDHSRSCKAWSDSAMEPGGWPREESLPRGIKVYKKGPGPSSRQSSLGIFSRHKTTHLSTQYPSSCFSSLSQRL
jgi:hypothetical protein